MIGSPPPPAADPEAADRVPAGAPIFHDRPVTLSPADAASVRGRHALVLVPAAGGVPQEILKPVEQFEAAGLAITFASPEGGTARFDPLCIGLAFLEAAWDPTLRLLRTARRNGRLSGLPSLRAMATDGMLERWLDGFDIVLVPGGHGRAYRDFIHDPAVIETVARFHEAGRVVGLVCHGPLVAALPGPRGPGFIRGKTVACWPRTMERLFGPVPMLGSYLMPYGRPVGVLLTEAGAVVHDSLVPGRRVHAVTDGRVITARGPWSMSVFAAAAIRAIARARPAGDHGRRG